MARGSTMGPVMVVSASVTGICGVLGALHFFAAGWGLGGLAAYAALVVALACAAGWFTRRRA